MSLALVTALASLGGLAMNYSAYQRGNRATDKFLSEQKQSAQKLDNMFNREYYQNYLDRSDSQNLLSNMRDQLSQQSKQLRNTAAVTGATPEATVAAQKYQTEALGKAAGAIAANGASWKSSLLNSYLSARGNINNRIADVQNARNRTNLEAVNSGLNFIQTYLNADE